MKTIAHQYKIRLEKSQTETIDFDLDEVSLKNTEIRKITKPVSQKIIKEYEWLKCLPTHTKYHYGIFFKIKDNEYLGGVLVYSPEYAENTGVWDKFGFTGKILLLSRGVCLWWTPKNTASYFISKVNKIIKKETHYRIITATVDSSAGEIGTIYQSMNWHYIGLMSGNYSKSGKEIKRISYLINGIKRSSRWVRKKIGTMKYEEVMKHFPTAEILREERKKRYFTFIDTKRNNKIYLNSLKPYLLPYPKRDKDDISGLIYKITNTINGKVYIGQTIRSVFERIKDYKRELGNPYLNNSFNKYGFENFKFEILETCDSIEEMNIKEIAYILQYDSSNKEKGYNLNLGGRNGEASEETRLKMSKAHKGKKQSKEWVRKRIPEKGSEEALKHGRPKSEEDRLYLSENSPKFWLGKTRSEETKNKISVTKKLQGLKPTNIKTVVSVNPLTNKIIEKFESSATASKYYGLNNSTIGRRCRGEVKNKGDIFFYYEEDYNNLYNINTIP